MTPGVPAQADEALLRSLLDVAADIYWEQDAQYRFTVFRASVAEIPGGESGYLGRRCWDVPCRNMTPDDWAAHRAGLEARRPFRDLELCRLDDSGRHVWLGLSGAPTFDAAGAFTGYRGVGRNITARKREQHLLALEHSVNRGIAGAGSIADALQLVMRSFCDSEGWECCRCYLLDADVEALRLEYAWHVPEPIFEEFIALARSSMVRKGEGLVGIVWGTGEPLWSTDLVNDPRAHKRSYSLATRVRASLNFPILAEGNVIGVLAFSARVAREPDDQLVHAVQAIGAQIGQFLKRKQAEAVLRESEARFRSLTSLSSDWYWEQDAEYRFVDMTSEIDRRTGVSSRAHIGKRRWEIAAPNMTEADWKAHRAIVEAHEPFKDLQLCRAAEDGSLSWVNISGEPIFGPDGAFEGYRGIGKDITARKREEQLLALEHAVTRSLAEADSTSMAIRAVIRAICESQGWECGRYSRVDEALGVMRYSESWAVADPQVEQFIAGKREVVFRPLDGLAGKVWQSGEPLWSTDTTVDARGLDSTVNLDTGMHGAFIFPVVAEGTTIGVMSFNSRAVRVPDERLLRAVRAIGSQIGQFLKRKEGEETLHRFRTAMDLSADAILLTDRATMRFVDVNRTACDQLGYTREELLKLGPQDINHTSRELQERVYDDLIAGRGDDGATQGVRYRKDGSTIPVEAYRRVIPNRGGHVIAVILRNISERIDAEKRLHHHARQQRLIAEFGQQAFANPQLEEILPRAVELAAVTLETEYASLLELAPDQGELGYKAVHGWPAAWIGTRTIPVAPGGRLHAILTRGERKIVEDYASEGRDTPSRLLEFGIRSGMQVPVFGANGAFGVLCVHTRSQRNFTEDDVTFLRSIANILAIAIDRKNAEDKLSHLARFDTVTGLPNRYLFRDRMDQTLMMAQRNQTRVGVLFIDLDRFKAVNDTYGHGVGDRLLSQTANRLKQCLRTGDTVGRLSGDEFAVVLTNLAQPDDAGLVAQKIVQSLSAAFEFDDIRAYVTASIGIALYPDDGADPDVLLKNADTAMYRAKEQGRNNYQFYLPKMNERLMQRLQIEAQLRGALDRHEFILHYQPKVSLQSGCITGFEALLRWCPGELVVSPGEFIPILEDTGLIVTVGEWVLRTVCRQIDAWRRNGIVARPVAVNLSARQFQRRNVVTIVAQALREFRVPPELLELEITETLLMGDPEEVVETLRELKSLGVRLTVDDFGTGYSSLAYLKRFPLDALKIDRTFIRDAVTDPDDATITLTIIKLAHSLDLKVVAEGVETDAQLQFLKAHDCDEMQGFYFARPLPVDECSRALVDDRRLESAASRPSPRPGSVLLVDDNVADLQLIERALEPGRFRIRTATSAESALEILAREGADIVISDNRMPGASGIEFLSNVRRLYPDTVRVVASGSDDRGTLIEAINSAGIHKFLSKTWDPDRLCSAVREAYEERR